MSSMAKCVPHRTAYSNTGLTIVTYEVAAVYPGPFKLVQHVEPFPLLYGLLLTHIKMCLIWGYYTCNGTCSVIVLGERGVMVVK